VPGIFDQRNEIVETVHQSNDDEQRKKGESNMGLRFTIHNENMIELP